MATAGLNVIDLVGATMAEVRKTCRGVARAKRHYLFRDIFRWRGNLLFAC